MNIQIDSDVRLFASGRSWIEEDAIRQLYATARLDGLRLAAGFPNLCVGKGGPTGAAYVTESVVFPHLISQDVGCGMALFQLDLVRSDSKLDRWAKIPFDLEHPWIDDITEVLAEFDLPSTEFDDVLGTLGGGAHFAELQSAEEVLNAREFRKLGLGKQQLVVLVHSGSRGLGESTQHAYLAERQATACESESFHAAAYLRGHDLAVTWAKVNRELLAARFAQALGAEVDRLWDGCHNSITRQVNDDGIAWVHRKGAVVAEGDAVVIAGSRGSLSYLVKPSGDGTGRAWSLANGAGRTWARSEARLRVRERFAREQLLQTSLGSIVVCGKRDLLYEEAPTAYKNIEAVIEDLVEAGVVTVIATFRPLLTYKTRARDYTG
jgi:release factor H-coupled RctB family protein